MLSVNLKSTLILSPVKDCQFKVSSGRHQILREHFRLELAVLFNFFCCCLLSIVLYELEETRKIYFLFISQRMRDFETAMSFHNTINVEIF